MTRGLVALALVLALPSAAGAQVRVPSTLPSAGAFRGIVVQARGAARFTPKTVQFVAVVRGNTDEPSALAAMRAAGIDDPEIGPLGGQIANGSAGSLRGTVHDATRAKLERIGLAAAEYIRTHPGVTIVNISFNAGADGCAQYEREARTSALAEARRKADAIAALSGLVVDGVESVSETGGCPSASEPPFLGASVLTIDIATMTAYVSVNESVAFAVSSAASRR